MKFKILTILLLITTTTFAQKEGQSFCNGDSSETYFPLLKEKKTLIWYGTYYEETQIGEKIIEGKHYKMYLQEWESKRKDTMYMRMEGNRVFEYYKEIKKEKLRYDSTFKPEKKWDGRDVTYTILSYNEELKTPACHYKNLMALKAVYQDITFIFYYLKGYGYIGATHDNRLVSYTIPKLP